MGISTYSGAAATFRAHHDRTRLRPRDEIVTVVFGTWLMLGLLLDGYAHSNLPGLETFFTPWHAVFYSGFTATAAWIGWQVYRNQRTGLTGIDAVPLGYGVGLLGLGVFAVGAVGDFAWHAAFGIETDQDLLFSPTHTLLFVGIILTLTSPLRAAWAADPPAAAPRLRGFLPVLVSTSMATFMAAFSFLYFSAFTAATATAAVSGWAADQSLPASGLRVTMWGDASVASLVQNWGIAAVFTTNLILLAPLLLLVRRWRVPFGAATILFTLTAAMTAAVGEFGRPVQVLAAFAGGLAADVFLARVRPAPERPVTFYATGLVVPLLLWSAWFAGVALTGGVGWSVEIWTGTIVWAGLQGLALSALMLPPRAPQPAAS